MVWGNASLRALGRALLPGDGIPSSQAVCSSAPSHCQDTRAFSAALMPLCACGAQTRLSFVGRLWCWLVLAGAGIRLLCLGPSPQVRGGKRKNRSRVSVSFSSYGDALWGWEWVRPRSLFLASPLVGLLSGLVRARPAHLCQLQAWHDRCQFLVLGACLQVSYSLQSPFGLFVFPVPFLLAYGVAKGNAGFEITSQDWAIWPFLLLPRVSRGRKASALQKCLRKLLPFNKGEFLPLFA